MPSTSSGPRQSEAPGLNCQLARIGVCAHRGGLVAPCAGNHEASGEDLLTGTLVRRLGLPGEQGFVDLETGRCSHHAVGHDLVTRAEADEVVEDHCFDRDVEFDPSRTTRARGSIEHGEAIQCALGPQLLDDPNERIGYKNDSKERILQVPNRQDSDEQRAQDDVEASDQVGPKDLAERSTGSFAAEIGFPPSDPLSDFCCAQP